MIHDKDGVACSTSAGTEDFWLVQLREILAFKDTPWTRENRDEAERLHKLLISGTLSRKEDRMALSYLLQEWSVVREFCS